MARETERDAGPQERFASPFRRKSRKGGYYCDLCDCFVGWTPTVAASHESGKRHWSNLTENVSIKEVLCTESWFCNVCKVNVVGYWGESSQKTFNKHVHGKKHRKAWRQSQVMKREDITLSYTHVLSEVFLPRLPQEVVEVIAEMAGLPFHAH